MSNGFDNHANLAIGQVLTAPSPASSGTTLTLLAGQGELFPGASFNCTVWPSTSTVPTVANSEIIRVTAISSDTFTIVRQQEGSNLQSIGKGWNVENTITAKVLTDVESAITSDVLPATFTTNGTVKQTVYNVRDYGTISGTANDDVAINAAITAANTAGGGVVQLTAGTYSCNNQIVLMSNVRLVGVGSATVIKMTNGANVEQFITATAITHASLENLKVDYNHGNNTSCQRGMWILAPSSYVTVRDCWLINAKGFAVGFAGNGTSNVNIRNDHCQAINNIVSNPIATSNDMFLVLSDYSYVAGNNLVGMDNNGGIVLYESDYPIAVGNHITMVHGTIDAIGVWSCRYGVVSNNTINGVGDGTGISVYTEHDNASPTTSYGNIIISNNINSVANGFNVVETQFDTFTDNRMNYAANAILFGSGTAATRPSFKFNRFTNSTNTIQTTIAPIGPYYLGNTTDINDLLGVNITAPTAAVDIFGSTTGAASLRLRNGVAPTSPNSGDIWYDGTHLQFRNGSTTDQLDSQTAVGTASGDLTGTYPNPILITSGITAGTYGSTNQVPVIIFDAKGRAVNSTNTPIQITESAVTNLTGDLAAKAPLASPALTGTPTAPTQVVGDSSTAIATDAFVMSAITASSAGLSVKASVQEATTTTLPTNTYLSGVLTATANGALIVDGITVSSNDRVLVKNETAQANNGIYVVTATGSGATPYVLTRSSDMNTASEFPGAFTFVEQGAVNTATGWVIASRGPFTIGTTAVVWTQFNAAATYTAGTGLTLSGTSFALTIPVSVTNGGTGVTSSTGTGNTVLSSGPTLVAPALGTPSSGVLTNTTGLPLTTGVSGTLPVTNGGSGTATAFTAGSLVFTGASGVYNQNNADLFWDNTNNRLGVGTASPANTFHAVQDVSAGTATFKFQNNDVGGTQNVQLLLSNSSTLTNTTVGGSILANRTNTTNSGDTDLVLQSSLATTMTTRATFKASGLTGLQTVTSPTAYFHLPASTTSASSLRIPSGTAPTTPNSGDIWFDGTHLQFENGSTTDQLDNQSANNPQVLAKITGINSKSVATTALYTVPTGKTAIVTAVIVRCTAATAITAGPTASVGVTASSYSDIYASTVISALTTTSNAFGYSSVGMFGQAAAASVVTFNLTNAATGTSQTIAVDVIGYLV